MFHSSEIKQLMNLYEVKNLWRPWEKNVESTRLASAVKRFSLFIKARRFSWWRWNHGDKGAKYAVCQFGRLYFCAEKSSQYSKGKLRSEISTKLFKRCTIRCQKLFHNLDVFQWLTAIFDVLLVQPMRVKVGFSFLTRHPLTNTIQYMYAAPELAYAETTIDTKVSDTLIVLNCLLDRSRCFSIPIQGHNSRWLPFKHVSHHQRRLSICQVWHYTFQIGMRLHMDIKINSVNYFLVLFKDLCVPVCEICQVMLQ